MKKIVPVAIGIVIVVGGIGAVAMNKSSNKSSTKSSGSVSTTQVVPIASNPIQNTSTQAGLTIAAIAVEDNVDPVTKNAINDRLQITLHNSSNQSMSNMEAYYSMKDSTTGQIENYYQKLTGLQLVSNETKTIYFDNESGAGHYPENKYSIYRTSKNEVVFTVQISTPNFKIAAAETKKSVGTGEKQD